MNKEKKLKQMLYSLQMINAVIKILDSSEDRKHEMCMTNSTFEKAKANRHEILNAIKQIDELTIFAETDDFIAKLVFEDQIDELNAIIEIKLISEEKISLLSKYLIIKNHEKISTDNLILLYEKDYVEKDQQLKIYEKKVKELLKIINKKESN